MLKSKEKAKRFRKIVVILIAITMILGIYIKEIYTQKREIKTIGVDQIQHMDATISAGNGTINPIYRPKWTKTSSTLNTDAQTLSIVVKGNASESQTVNGANIKYNSDVTSALSADDIIVYVDGELDGDTNKNGVLDEGETPSITKAVSTADPSATSAEVTHTITLSNFGEALRQEGKEFREWSGNVAIKIGGRGQDESTYSANVLTDKYGNESMMETDMDGTNDDGSWVSVIFKDGSIDHNANGTMFTDFVKPEFTYEYANTVIDHDTKTVTVVFDVTDKYFASTVLATDPQAENITVKLDGKEATNATKTLTKLSDITATVNGNTSTKIGEKYQLVVSNLDQGSGDDYSGIMTLAFPADIITDKSANTNIPKTITIGTDDPTTDDGHDKDVIVDVVDPVWKIENISIDGTTKTVKADLIATDKYLTGVDNCTLTTDDITLSVDGDENANTAITKTLSDPTFSENVTTGMKEIKYTLTLDNWEEATLQDGKSFFEYSGTVKIKIKEGTITDDARSLNNANGAKPSELFDQAGSNADGLHIGDFVNYDAGTWTQNEIDSIKTGLKTNLQTANGTATLPNMNFQFGGFTAGSSRNGNAIPYENTYNYIKDTSTNSAITGWRVFDIDGDMVTLISAGNPEDYCHDSGYAGEAEYILTGNDNDYWSENGAKSYQKRDWKKYVNGEQKAISAIPLTKTRLENWYQKNNIDTNKRDLFVYADIFERIYEESYIKYQNIIDNYSYYWLTDAYDTNSLYYFLPGSRCLTYSGTGTKINVGIRLLVTLSPDVLFNSEKTGTKTLTGGNMDTFGGNQTYNCWSIATSSTSSGSGTNSGSSTGTGTNNANNTSKETEFEIGHVDFIKPRIIKGTVTRDIDKKTVTIAFGATDKYLDTTSEIDLSKIKVQIDGEEATGITKTLTRETEKDVSITINGKTQVVSQQYKLVLSDFEQSITEIDATRNYVDWSGTVTVDLEEGVIKDKESNGTSNFNDSQTINAGIVDFIAPKVTYQYVNGDINYNQKTFTMKFDITDKYFTSSTLATEYVNAVTDEDKLKILQKYLTIKVDGEDVTTNDKVTKRMVTIEDVQATRPINKTIDGVVQTGLTNQVIGKSFTLEMSALQQNLVAVNKDYLDYSGVITVAVKENVAMDNGPKGDGSNKNGNINTTITSGVDIPTQDENKEGTIVDVVDPIWEVAGTATAQPARQTANLPIKGTDKYIKTINLTPDDITVEVDGVLKTSADGISVTITEDDTAMLTYGKQYNIKIDGYSSDAYQVRVTIREGTIADNSGNTSKQKSFILFSSLKNTSQETGDTSPFLGNSNLQRKKIEKIIFQDSLDGINDTRWDVTQMQDESIWGWYTTNATTGNYTVYIGSYIIMNGNVDSSYLFSYIGSDSTCKVTGNPNATDGTQKNLIENIELLHVNAVKNMSHMFDSFGNKTMKSFSLGTTFDTGMVKDMAGMFRNTGYTAMTSLNLGDKFNTGSVTSMNGMFYGTGYTAMKSLDLGDKFDTRNVTDMGGMFKNTGYTAMTSLNLGNKFDTNKATNMESMFNDTGHTAMTSLDLGNKFYTTSATNMENMFLGCGTTALKALDLGPGFTKIASQNTNIFTNTGTADAIIYAPESIVKDEKYFKLSTSDESTTINYANGTINPIYKPELTKISSTLDTTDPNNPSMTVVVKADANKTQAINGVNIDYKSDIVNTLTPNDITVYVNGEEANTITKQIVSAEASINAETGKKEITYTIKLTNFDEGKRKTDENGNITKFNEWSGNISIQFAKGTIKDMYGSQFNNDGQFTNIAGNGNIAEFTNKDNVTNKILIQEDEQYDKNTTGKMFADTINPEFTYEYANTVIDHDTKTVTVVFDVADKYFETSGLTADTTAEKIALKIGGVTPTNATKILTKISDLTATVNGVENTKVGEKYQLVVSNIDQGDGGDYSGVMTMAFEAGLLTDKSGNESIAKTITIGIDEPATDDESSTDGPYLPTGFTHVEGTSLDNGYTVQDSKGNQFVWVEVPKTADVYPTAGLKITEFTTDAYTKIENDLHTYTSVYRKDEFTDEWGTKENNYSQDSTGMTSDQYTELKQKMLKSIYQNGGFYIGKYETGIEGTPRTSGDANTMPTETPVIKQNAYPYNWVTSSQAQALASKFASDLNGYTSSLLFGVQWDLTLKYLETKGATQAELNSDSTNWGNYYDNLWNITNTNSKYSTNDGRTWTNGAHGKKYSSASILLSTGASDTFSKQGIYDLAGNVDEWTLEADSFAFRNGRGGSYGAPDRFTADFRSNYYPTYTSTYFGSRLALYKDVAQTTNSDASGTGSKPVIVDVVDPIWKIKNVNIDSASKKVTAEVIATDKYLSGVANSTLTTNDITLTVDGDVNANNAITKTLSTPTFSENTETGLKEIRYTLTLENWEEAEKQTGKTFLEYSGTAKIKIAEGTVVDDAEGALEPGQVSDGKHNTNREYEFELGHVDLIKPRIEKEKAETDETAKTETITFNVVDKYLDTTKEITADEIKVYVDGEEATTLTKELTRVEANDKSATINGNAQVVSQQYQLKLSDFEKARNDKNYKDWSGTVTIEIVENAVKDKVIESGTEETGKNTSGGNTNDVTEIDGKFVDFITPDLKYVHQDVDIDKTGKTYTMTFTVTDKYYKSGKLGIDDLTIKMQNGQKDADGNEIIYNLKNEPVTISLQDAELKAQNVPITNETTGVVETVSELLIGHTYTLTISDLEQLEIKEGLSTADYSGIVTVAVDGNKIKDRGPSGNNTNANGNIATTITSGVNIPGGTTPDDAKAVDVVDPIWEKISSSASAIDPADKTSSTATVKFRGTDTYFTESTLTSDKIKVLVNGAEATGITKELSEATALTQERKEFGKTTTTTKQYGVEYTLTIKGFAHDVDQVKVQLPAGTLVDESGNGNKVTELIVYNTLRSAAGGEVKTKGFRIIYDEQSAFLGNSSIWRYKIENVTFETNIPDTVYNATTGEYVDNTAWDVSAIQDKSIIAWYETSNDQGKLKVHIGSNDEIYANQDSSYLFAGIEGTITNIGLLNVSSVTKMKYMFCSVGYTAMTSLNLGDKFDTSNVTDMSGMFAGTGYGAMTSLDLGDKFDTSNVTNMEIMFLGTGHEAMTSLDLGDKFNTSKVTNMSYMFNETGYTAMTSLDLKDKFDTSNVTNMENMFLGTGHEAMTSLDLGDKFDTSNVTNMEGMFQETGHEAMTSLDLGDKFDTSNVTNMENMFWGTGHEAMTSLDLGDKFDTSNVTDMARMFNGTGYTAMTSLDLGDKFYTTSATNMAGMFYETGATLMTTLDLGPAFTKIASTSTFSDTGKENEITIYASEQIYLDKNNFKADTNATESLINYTRGTINPKYRTEWIKESSTISEANKNIAITLKGTTNAEAGVDFTSNVTSSLTIDNVHVYVDGEEATTITKSLATPTTAVNAVTGANDVIQVLTLSNLEEAVRQQGKDYKEWSGNISLKIDKKTLTDDIYSNQNLQAIDTTGNMIDIELKDEATDKNTDGTMFTDYIEPEFTYIYSNGNINYEDKTLTLEFSVTDKYFNTSAIINNVDNLEVKLIDTDPNTTIPNDKITKELTKIEDISKDIDGDGELEKVGEKYKLVIKGLEQQTEDGKYKDYSGPMSISIPAGVATDKSGNTNIAKTITIGVNEPGGNPEDQVVVDVVDPLWKTDNINIDHENKKVTVDLIGTDKYYASNSLTTDSIKVTIDGEEVTSTANVQKSLSEATPLTETRNGQTVTYGIKYTLTLSNWEEAEKQTNKQFFEWSGTTSIEIAGNTLKDESNNTSNLQSFELGHADFIKPKIEKVSSTKDADAKTETIIFNAIDKYLDTTKEITTDEISVYVDDELVPDGQITRTLTKESDLTGTVNGTSKIIGHQYKLVLSDFEQIRTAINYNREFSDWSGTVSIKVAEGAVKDTNTPTPNGNEETTLKGDFVDFIKPNATYQYTASNIDYDGKTFTMVFDLNDKYYLKSAGTTLTEDNLNIKIDGETPNWDNTGVHGVVKELTGTDITNTVNVTEDGVVKTATKIIGRRYTLKLSHLEQLEKLAGKETMDYSGVITVAVPSGIMVDTSHNQNNAVTITSGIEVKGEPVNGDGTIVDVVDPIWERVSSSASAANQTATITVKGTDKYFASSNLTADKIKVLVNGQEISENVSVNVGTATPAYAQDGTTRIGDEYTITVSGSGLPKDTNQIKVQIQPGAITDNSGNTNKATDLLVYNTLIKTDTETETTSGFLGSANSTNEKVKTIQRQNIDNVTFMDNIPSTVYDKSAQAYVDDTAWDVSAMQDKSILAWYTTNANGSLKVYIGSDNEIFGNYNSSYLFASIGYSNICTATETITNISLLNVGSVTNMSNMFKLTGYNAMTSLDLGNKFDTSNVTDMNNMFNGTGYTAMTTLNLENKFDTSNVTDMNNMFNGTGYTAMTGLDLGDKFDTSNVTDMSHMFEGTGYTAMTSFNLRDKFNTSNVTDMQGMFKETGYTAMQSLNLGEKFDTSNVTNMQDMFRRTGYTAMTSLNLKNKFNTNSVRNMMAMFWETGCTAMTSLELGNEFNTKNVTNMEAMFYKTGYTVMTSLDLGDKFDTSNVTDMIGMFNNTGSTAMTTLDLGPAFTQIAQSKSVMFENTGKDGAITIYASEQIYLDKNNFKKNTDATESLISFTRGTINPKYRTEWVKEASTISKADKNIAITLRGRTNAEAGVDFTSNVTSSLTAENIHVYFDGEEATTITKSLADATTATNAVTNANDVLQVLTLSNLEEALRQQGKNFKEWSGNITLKIDKKTLTDDTYSNQNLQAIDTTGEMIDIELKDTATDKNENSTMFTDYINPEFTYEYFNTETDTDANTVIDYERKTITVVFDVTDKYFKESNITADNMTIKVGGEEPDWTKSTKTLTKKTLDADKVVGNITYKANGDIYYTVNGTPTKIGERYELVVSNLEVENGVGYSGAMTLSFPAGELNSDGTLKNGIVDKSGNLSINKTITIGIDEPENPEHPDHKQDEKIVDLVNPLWTGPHNVNSINRTNNTVDIKLLGSDQYYDTDVFAQGLANGTINEALSKIKVYVDGEEQTSITKSIVKITDSTELQELIAKSDLQSAKAEDVKVGYTLTLGNFGELNGETKIVIEAGTITDLSGNRNRETTIPVGNISWKEANEPLQESDTGYPRYHAFREDIVDFVKPVIRYQYSAVEDDTTKANPEIDYEAKTLTVRFTVTDKYLVESSVMNADGTLNTNNVRLKISTLSDSGNEEFKDITDEGISTTITSTQITDGYEYTLVVKDFEQVYNNKGKYMDYSGIVQLAFAEGQIDDTSGNKNIATTITVDTGTGDNPNGGVVVDVIDPIIEKTAENLSIVNSSNGINRDKENETGTVTMMIKATDKYLSTGTLQNAENVAKIKVKVVKPDGTEVIPDTITKSVTQVSKQSTSITYRITLGNFETNEGVTSVIIPEGVITDRSGNGNKETEILVGNSTWTETGDAKGEYTAFKNSIVDFTMPVWKYATSSITRNRDGETGTVKVKILGSDIYYLKDTLTTDNIFVYVANSETPDAPVTTITKSLEKITDTADLEGADTGYYLTLGNFGTHDGQVKITIADNTIKDTSGNGNKITEILVGNPNWVETDVGDSSESPKYTAFRDSIVDFIKPTLKYKYTADANPIIDQENKTFTMTFDAIDTNFLESSLTVSDIRILVDDVDVTDTLTKTLTSADITDGSANGLRYTLTLKDFELERILEGDAFKRHSGKIELVVAAGKVKDTSGNENIETRIIVDNDDGDDAENYVRVDFIKPTLYFVEKHISWDNRYATVTIAGTDRFYDFNTKLDPNDIKLYQENLNGEYVQVTNLPVSINSVKTDYGYNFVIRLDDFEEEYKMKISIPAGKIGDLDGHYNDATDIIVGLDNKKPVWRYLSTDTSQFESDGKVSFNVKGQDKFLDLTKSGLQDGDVSVYRDGVNISDSVGITINYQGQDETEKSKSYKIDVSGMTETGTYSLVFKDKTLIDEFNNESATTTITFSKSIISSNTDNYQKVTYHASPDFETTHEAYVHELMSVNTTGTNAEATTFRPSTVGEIYDDGKNTLFAEPFSYAGGTQSAYSFKGWALANENGFIIDKDGNKLATSEGSTFDETKATIYGLYDEIPDTAKSADDMVHLKAVWQNAKVIFVSNGNGNNSADGLSPTTPVKDLQTAYGKLNTNGTASTNIIVIMDKVEWKDSTKLTGNATITSLYAGVDYKASGAELKISSNLEVDGDIKFDNIKLYSNSTTVNDGSDYLANETYTNMLITNYGDVTLGRRISTPDDKYTFGAVVGGNYKTESTIGEIGIHSVIVEAGRYNNIVIGSALNAGGQTTKSKYVSHQVLIGNMKDSAISRNDKLTITGSLLMGELEDRCYPYNSSGSQDTANAYTRTYAITKIYSGTFTGHNKFAKASEDASIYLRSMNGFTDGATRFEMYGGNITGNVYAGARMATTGADQDENILNFYGGNITGNVFGHGSNDASVGYSNIELGGNFAITGNVFGGSNATTIGQGRITGNTTITVNTASANINGNIYGGSNGTINGDSINLNNGAITGNTNVVINAGVITGNIYGGGNNCGSSGSANITINNGAISGDIYGGAYQNQVRTESNIVIKGGSVNNIYGGNELTSQAQQNNDGSRQNTNITIEGANAKVEGTIYGGGIFEKVATATINLNSCETVPTVYGGSKGAGITEEANINLNGMTVSTIYGGTNGNGTVTTANINLKSGTVTDVYGGGYGGTTTTSNINLGSSDGGTATVTSIYGGPNLGGTVGTSNVMLKSGTVTNVFGGGNSAEVRTANVTLDGITIDTIHGGSKDSRVTANTNVILKSGTVTNVFGGGLGTSTTNAKVTQQGANVENIYGGGYGGTGNGGTTANATVNIDSGKVENVYGGSMNKGITQNAIINIRGTSLITNKIYGGGYKTDIGKSDNSGSTTINISGGTINKDLFGGAEGAVVHGITNINIGVDAVSDNSPVAGNINIRGNIYGGGTSTSVDYSLNSVEGDTHITMTNSTRSPITFSKNIFGSGKGTNYSTNNTINDGSTIKLNNFGTSRSSYRMTSIQRTGKVSIGNSYLELFGAQDNYNYYRNTLYTLNRVTKGLALHDNTTLYTRRGFNMVGGFESYLTDASGNQSKETVSISGNKVTRNVDNRIYTFEGINLIFAKQEGELSDKANQDIWGDVSGMAFFGMYRINRTSFEKEYDIYAPNYTGGAKENFFANGTYIEGRHKANHDTTVDGFYTNVGDYTNPSNITVFPKVIEVTDYGTYYDWIIGEDIVNYDVGPLIASTYSTYSTAELKLDYKYRQGAIYTLNRVSANAIDENINLVNSSSIPTIASGDSANNTFAVTMEGEKTGWLQNGVTNMYTDNNGSFDGNTVYKSDNSSNPGSLIFKIHNSINVSETKDLGNVNIVLIGKTRTADDASEGNVFRVIISVSLQSLYEEPKEQYTPRFTDSTETNLNYTTDSSIDVSYLLYKNGLTDTIYETGDYRVLSSTVQLPAGTKITMRDYGQGDSVNKVYNYQIGSNTAYDATETVDGKTRYLYKLSHFKNIGTNVSDFSGTGDYRDNNSSYYHSGANGSGYVLEKYDISIDLENSNINTNKLAQETYLQLRSADGRLKYDNGDKDLTYNLYNNNATMKESISNEGKTYSVFENLTIPFTLDSTLLEKVVGNGGTVEEANGGNATESTRIHDTKYYDKKVGLGIEIIDDVGERVKAPEVQNLQLTDARDSTIKYEAGNDGVIRIPLSEGMANIKNSYNLSLSQYRVPAGTYKVKVYFYASDDGLYYEGEKTVVKEFNITFINRLLGLAGVESTNDSRIINKTTGMNLEGNRGLDLTVKVSSPTNDTNVRVELYKRNPTYTETEDTSGTGSTVKSYTGTQYTLVDFGQYIEGNWEKPEDQGLETPEGNIEYIVMPKENYESAVALKEVEFKKAIKENIGTGEYKLVFKACYDNTVIQEVSKTFVVTP